MKTPRVIPDQLLNRYFDREIIKLFLCVMTDVSGIEWMTSYNQENALHVV